MKKFEEIKTIVENRNIDILELIEYMDKEKFFKKREKEYLELSLQGNDIKNIANVLELSLNRIREVGNAVLYKIKRDKVLDYFLEEVKGIKLDNPLANRSNEFVNKYNVDISDYIDFIFRDIGFPSSDKVIANILASGGTIKDILIHCNSSRKCAESMAEFLYHFLFEIQRNKMDKFLESKGLNIWVY